MASPDAPTGLSATPGDGQVGLSWADPSDDTIVDYDYRVSADSGTNCDPDWTDIADSDATTTSATVGDLNNGTLYTIELRATNGGSEGASARTEATPTATDNPPTISSPAAFSVVENTTGVGRVVVTDADDRGTIKVYTISGGADPDKFQIDPDGELKFISAPNFEDPQDAASAYPENEAGINEYIVEVTVSSSPSED